MVSHSLIILTLISQRQECDRCCADGSRLWVSHDEVDESVDASKSASNSGRPYKPPASSLRLALDGHYSTIM